MTRKRKKKSQPEVSRRDYIIISNKAKIKTLRDFNIKPKFLTHKKNSTKKIHIWDIGDTWCRGTTNGGIYLMDWDIITDETELIEAIEKLGLQGIEFCTNCATKILNAGMEHLYETYQEAILKCAV